jgi:tape measure domain-containing protein
MPVREILVEFGVHVDQAALIQLQNNVNRAVIRFSQLRRIASFALAALGVGAVTDSADELISYQNRLQSVTNSLEEYKAAEEGVIEVSRNSLSSVKDTAAVYQRYAQVTDNLNLTQDELLQFTQSLTKAMKLGGSSAAEARGALIQLGQGLGNDFKSGGQELNSIIEQAPKLANILAKAAGGTRGELKDLARAGKLSGKVVVKAITDATEQIDADFAKRQKSFDDIKTLMETEWMMLLKQFMPLIVQVIDHLLRGVEAFRGWVERGEAFNSVISASVVVVGALTYALSGLLARLLWLSAPAIALFTIIEDFVGFMRGQKSLIGLLLFDDDKAKIDAAKEDINRIWEYLKGFFKWLKNPEDGMFDGLKAIFRILGNELSAEIDKVYDKIKNNFLDFDSFLRKHLRATFGDTISDMLNIPLPDTAQDVASRSKVRVTQDSFSNYDAGESGRSSLESALSTMLGSISPILGVGSRAAFDLATMTRAGAPTSTAPAPSGPVAITNNVTVNGNADANTARTIAKETGKETAASLGRDKDALGAAVGLQ